MDAKAPDGRKKTSRTLLFENSNLRLSAFICG